MSLKISEVLHRRTDLSTFVVHLTRDKDGRTARQRLDSIISERKLRATTAMGWAKDQDDRTDDRKQSQRVVCFSETPLEHIYWLVAEIERRDVQLKPYGLTFPKMAARRLGINPIWYVDMSLGPGGSFREWHLANALDRLRNEAVEDEERNFHDEPIAGITPFLEHMGTGREWQKEWWWEREWRHVGDLQLPDHGIIWLCPEDDPKPLPVTEPVIDPRWGLEQIIAHLANFPVEDVTPFAPRKM